MTAVTFHKATVASIEPLTDDAVCVTLSVPDDVADEFDHTPGQHLTFRTQIDGTDVRRSYSICSRPGPTPSVGIKKLPGGVFSTYVHEQLSVGDVVEVTTPRGDFCIDTDPDRATGYVAFAAGSGITPVLSMIRTVLAEEPHSMFTLVYGNRTGQTVMFLDEIDDLKGQYPDRFVVLHVLSRESQQAPLLTGRIDAEKTSALLGSILDADRVSGWYLCGPRGMVDAVRSALVAAGVNESDIDDELFYAGEVSPASVAVDDAIGSTVTFTLAGRTSTTTVAPDGAPILDHVLSVRPDGPYSCRSGACASCRAVIVKGEVTMDRNWSLSEDEVKAGHILTCQSHPVSADVEITYDI